MLHCRQYKSCFATLPPTTTLTRETRAALGCIRSLMKRRVDVRCVHSTMKPLQLTVPPSLMYLHLPLWRLFLCYLVTVFVTKPSEIGENDRASSISKNTLPSRPSEGTGPADLAWCVKSVEDDLHVLVYSVVWCDVWN